MLSDRATAVGRILMFRVGDREEGVSYREWLIGQAITGSALSDMSVERGAWGAIEIVDAILEKLAEEYGTAPDPNRPAPRPIPTGVPR